MVARRMIEDRFIGSAAEPLFQSLQVRGPADLVPVRRPEDEIAEPEIVQHEVAQDGATAGESL